MKTPAFATLLLPCLLIGPLASAETRVQIPDIDAMMNEGRLTVEQATALHTCSAIELKERVLGLLPRPRVANVLVEDTSERFERDKKEALQLLKDASMNPSGVDAFVRAIEEVEHYKSKILGGSILDSALRRLLAESAQRVLKSRSELVRSLEASSGRETIVSIALLNGVFRRNQVYSDPSLGSSAAKAQLADSFRQLWIASPTVIRLQISWDRQETIRLAKTTLNEFKSDFERVLRLVSTLDPLSTERKRRPEILLAEVMRYSDLVQRRPFASPYEEPAMDRDIAASDAFIRRVTAELISFIEANLKSPDQEQSVFNPISEILLKYGIPTHALKSGDPHSIAKALVGALVQMKSLENYATGSVGRLKNQEAVDAYNRNSVGGLVLRPLDVLDIRIRHGDWQRPEWMAYASTRPMNPLTEDLDVSIRLSSAGAQEIAIHGTEMIFSVPLSVRIGSGIGLAIPPLSLGWDSAQIQDEFAELPVCLKGMDTGRPQVCY